VRRQGRIETRENKGRKKNEINMDIGGGNCT
jgi:hypothetical protein